MEKTWELKVVRAFDFLSPFGVRRGESPLIFTICGVYDFPLCKGECVRLIVEEFGKGDRLQQEK